MYVGDLFLHYCVEQKDMCLLDIVRSPWPKTQSIFSCAKPQPLVLIHISCVVICTPFQVQFQFHMVPPCKRLLPNHHSKTPFPRQIVKLHIAYCNKQTKIHESCLSMLQVNMCRSNQNHAFADIRGQPSVLCNEQFDRFHRTYPLVTNDLDTWRTIDSIPCVVLKMRINFCLNCCLPFFCVHRL